MVEIRTLSVGDETRAAHNLFRASLHRQPMSEDQWEHSGKSFEPGRTLGAFDGDRMVGTALAWTSDLVVPGGAVLPLAAVTRVGVRADFRRRGVLTALMRAQIDDFAARGEVFAALHASEPVIYSRFGYGVATRSVRVSAERARLRPEVPRGGSIRIIEPGDKVLPEVYERGGRTRAGSIARPPYIWVNYDRAWAINENIVTAVHTGDDGDDGFVTWRPAEAPEPGARIPVDIEDLVAASPSVAYALWDFVLGMDLVGRVRAWYRPVDEPLSAAVVDSRTVSVDAVDDDLWLRIVDVPAALAGRAYGDGPPVVIQVVDAFRPANSGRYRITRDGARRCDEDAAVSVDVDVLAMPYLGAWTWSALAAAGRVRVADPAALPALDRLFAVDQAPFTGTPF